MRKPASVAQATGIVERLSATYGHLWGRKPHTDGQLAGRLGAELREVFASPAQLQALSTHARQAAELGLVAGRLGEISQRLEQGKFLVTAAESWFYQLADAELLLAGERNPAGPQGAALPAHWAWHLLGYQQHPAAGASLLGQPAAAMALLAAGRLPDLGPLPRASHLGTLAYCASASTPSPASIGAARVLFIQGAGVLVLASSAAQAISDLHLVNRLSEISLLQTRGID
ncbi:MAG: class II aldolase/adducin family protein [Anaerolineales bacterium]|nr:class II aldolase/adducin family protein [Anaerolineales bacterium]